MILCLVSNNADSNAASGSRGGSVEVVTCKISTKLLGKVKRISMAPPSISLLADWWEFKKGGSRSRGSSAFINSVTKYSQ